MDIAGLVLDFIHGYGLLAIFILLVMDGALMLPVFPGEVVMIIAVTAYVHDTPSLVFLILFTTAAGLVGSLLLYAMTRGGGRRLVERFPRLFMMPAKRRERMERSFRRPVGQTMVLFLRLFPLTRVLVNIPAGLAKMPIVRFLIMSTVGLLAYHAAFLWFAHETQRPDSAIATQKAELQATYAAPAWDFVETNAIISGAVILVVAVVLSIRAANKMRKDPAETPGSLVGWATTMVLLWGGAALGVITYLEPQTVYAFARLGGLDLVLLGQMLGYDPVWILFGTAALAILFGYMLARLRARARSLRKKVMRAKRIERKRQKSLARQARKAPATTGERAPTPTDAYGEPVAFTPVRPARFTVDPGPADADDDAEASSSRRSEGQEPGIHEDPRPETSVRAGRMREPQDGT